MEQNKYLGIYIAPDKATVVLASKSPGRIEIVDYFCVRPEVQEQQQGQKFTFAQTAEKIASICSEKHFVFSEVAAAVDCRLYRQQKLHSEFQDYRQIAQTIRFDAEEALAVDAAQTAVAFEIIGKQISGSDVAAFAAPTDLISEIITSLQNNKLDPVTIEPDSICLRRIVDDGKGTITVVVSQTRCFLICPAGTDGRAVVRSFLTSPSQDKNAMFAREIMMTMTSLGAGGRTEAIKVYDTTGKLDLNTLGEQTAIAVSPLDIDQKVALPSGELQQDCEYLELIIAAQAAASLTGRTDKVDFRVDFMPYEGRKAAIERMVKIISIGLSIIFVVLGIALHMHYYSIAKDRARIDAKFKGEYIIAMPGSKFSNSKEALRKLKSEINRIKDVKSGLLSAAGEDSVEAKMTFLFEALNNVPKNVDIQIDKISVTTKAMDITGSTNLGGYLQLFAAFDKHPKLARGSSTFDAKDGRDNFRLTLELKQGGSKE